MVDQQSTAPKVNRAAQFKRNLGEPLMLPSGIEIIARRAPLMSILRHPSLPDPIAGIVNGMIEDRIAKRRREQASAAAAAVAKSVGETSDAAADDELTRSLTNVIMQDPVASLSVIGNTALILCGVDPIFVAGEAEAENEVSVADVDLADKVYVFNWLAGTTMDVANFRGFAPATVAASPAS